MAVPTLSSGTVSRFIVLLAAVTAATAVLPSTLTAHCMITLPMAVILHCRPIGTPMPIRRVQARLLKASSPFCICSTSNLRHRKPKLTTPEMAWEISVASAAPRIPILNGTMNKRSRPMFRALVRIRKYSGVLLSPRARMMLATMLYKKMNGMLAKIQPI